MRKQSDKQLTKITKKAKNGLGIVEFLLGILMISILSALTIPAIVYKNKSVKNKSVSQNAYNADFQAEKQLYKNAYTEASQIWGQLYREGVLNPRQGWSAEHANYNNFTQFMNKFSIIKQCNAKNISDCWAPNETAEVVSGHPDSSGDRCFIDSSGRAWCEAYYWGWFVVDTNGFEKPNKFGKDRFIFYTIVGNDINAAGIPDKIISDNDYTAPDSNKCPNPPCYYTSWISQ